MVEAELPGLLDRPAVVRIGGEVRQHLVEARLLERLDGVRRIGEADVGLQARGAARDLEAQILAVAEQGLLGPRIPALKLQRVARERRVVRLDVQLVLAIEPVAGALFGFWVSSEYSAIEATTYHAEREAMAEEYTTVQQAWFGTPFYGLEDMGTVVADDPRFSQCAVKSMAKASDRFTAVSVLPLPVGAETTTFRPSATARQASI